MNYYNEFDAKAAAWIQELINQKLIPPGIVDTRSICDVRADELMEYRQCHFFAGVAGWSKALQLAGVDPNEPLWTGSCPCQPFSTAGKRGGVNDERHLWPIFYNLIKECRPPKVIGEQVASSEIVGTELEASFIIAVQSGDFAKANKLANKLVKSSALHYWRRWVDGVHADMAAIGYTFRPEVLGAHSVGAPHMRQRLYWGAERVSDSNTERCNRKSISEERRPDLLKTSGSSNIDSISDTEHVNWGSEQQPGGEELRGPRLARGCQDNRMAEISESVGRRGWSDGMPVGMQRQVQAPGLGACGGMVNGIEPKLQRHAWNGDNRNEPGRIGENETGSVAETSGAINNAVADLPCEQTITTDKRGLYTEPICGSLSSVPWSRYALIWCRDNKVRRVPAESVLFSMVDGLPSGMDISRADRGFPLCQTSSFEKGQIAVLLKGYGNSINPYTAAKFIVAFM